MMVDGAGAFQNSELSIFDVSNYDTLFYYVTPENRDTLGVWLKNDIDTVFETIP